MKLIVMALFDVRSQAFGAPIFVPRNEFGVRSVADEVNKGGNMLSAHPEDFRLFELGSWDDNSGLFSCHSLPVLVVDCSTLKT